MDTQQTIDTFVEFFRSRGHERITGSTLISPPGDPVLFTSAGMHPLTPYLDGDLPHPLGRRLVNNQRCLRTTDLDEVGDPTHLTVFEMLGSWSLGDYPHVRSLRWGYELLRDGFGVDPGRLHVTVFGGDDQVPPDTGSIEVWTDLGVPIELTIEDNWWSNGPVGPCGPDSEIFVWTGDSTPSGTPTTDPRWVEVWNHVSMGYRRFPDGSLVPLPMSNVDTGMGLERMVTVLQGRRSVFQTDLFRPWTRVVPRLWPGLDLPGERVVLDHLRSSVVVVGDGVRPSNTGRGYVLRRLIRRLLTTLWRLDPAISLGDLPDEPFLSTLDHFVQDPGTLPVVRSLLHSEEERFRVLLQRGRDVVSRHRSRSGGPLDDGDYRYLHDTHGLPRDLVMSLLTDGRPQGRVG
jgi:alanyl-tRNA synthetase